MGKGEIAHNQHFILFPPCFLPLSKPISAIQFILSAKLIFQIGQALFLLHNKRLIKDTKYNMIIQQEDNTTLYEQHAE